MENMMIDKSLVQFEADFSKTVTLSKQLKQMHTLTSMIMYSIEDIKDWQSLKKGFFEKRSNVFNL